MSKRYGVDVSENGCRECGAGRQYAVVDRFDPEGTAELLGMTFPEDEGGDGSEDADAIAEALNDAFESGFLEGRRGLTREATEAWDREREMLNGRIRYLEASLGEAEGQ